MNASMNADIRELTADELDTVSGGFNALQWAMDHPSIVSAGIGLIGEGLSWLYHKIF